MAVQAIIMAGGAGTRLRPLTCEYPKPLAPLCGDIETLDERFGEREPADARLALRASVKLEHYIEGSAPYLAADVDHNGKIGSDDARMILRASVKLETLA